MTNAIGEIITPGELRALVQRAEQAERERHRKLYDALDRLAALDSAKKGEHDEYH